MNGKKLLVIFIILSFVIISLTPVITISVVKGSFNDNINDISNLKYDISSSVYLSYDVNQLINGNVTLVGTIPIYIKNYSFTIGMNVEKGNISFIGNSYGLNPTGMKEIIFADSQSLPSDCINANISDRPHTSAWEIVNSPYNKLFGYINTECLNYISAIPFYPEPLGPGGPISSGTVGSTIYSGTINGGRVMYHTDATTELYGNKTCYEKDLNSFSPINRDFFGPTPIDSAIIKNTNASFSFRLFSTTTYSLIYSNIVFPVNIAYYLEMGLLTWAIVLVGTGLYLYGRSRHWSKAQSIVIPIISVAGMSLFILPYTYLLYLL